MFHRLAAFLIVVTGVAIGLTPSPSSADTSPPITLDSQVIESAAGTNYGSSINLSARKLAGSYRYSYIKIAAPVIPGERLKYAQLRLFVTTTVPGAMLFADPVTTSWNETTVTYDNRPTATTTPTGVPAVNGWVTVPVTVIPGQVASFRIRTNSDEMIVFSSSENTNGNGPKLWMETAPQFVPQTPITTKLIGMTTARTAGDAEWDARVAEVGGPCGLETRRVYAELSPSGTDKGPLIENILADGMIPVISYKLPALATNDAPQRLVNGEYDAWLRATNTYLSGLDANLTVTYWHEPLRGDNADKGMTPALFRAGSQKFLDFIDSPTIAHGPILQGWPLDDPADHPEFASYTSAALLAQWDFFGVDSYQSGTVAAPGNLMPGRAITAVETWLDGQNQPDMPILLGEYNAFTGAALTSAEQQIFETPELWTAIVWNTNGTNGLGTILTGDRTSAFAATKSHANARHDPGKCDG